MLIGGGGSLNAHLSLLYTILNFTFIKTLVKSLNPKNPALFLRGKTMPLKILFDGDIFTQAVTNLNKAQHTGLFNAALYLAIAFDKREEVYIYVPNCLNLVQKCLKEAAPKANFKYLHTDVKFYSAIVNKRNKAKREKKIWLKHLLKIPVVVLSPLKNLIASFKKRSLCKNINSLDLYFSPFFKKPDFIKLKSFTLLHDVTPLIIKAYKDMENKRFKALCESLNSNDIYFANSEATRRDFLKFFPQIPANHIITTLLAVNTHFYPRSENEIKAVRQKYKIAADKAYIFSLCTIEPRKNLIRMVKTFVEFTQKHEIKDLIFVLGGAHWEEFLAKFEAEVASLGEFSANIQKIGYVDDEDLPALYSGAKFFVYTSQYEGFGLPVLEAMSCGGAVISSNNSSLPEVIGDAGICIDYDSDTQHIEAYERFYFDEKEREKFAQKGLERAKNFSWDKCAGLMIETMRANLH